MFYEHNGIFRVKIYQPYNKDFKWTTNLDSTVVDGYKELEDSELLVITKSRKDRLVLNNLGYQSISTNNEGSFLPDDVFIKLRQKYQRIVLLFDNDKAGVETSKKFSELYDMENIAIPTCYKEKDIADFRKTHGEKESINLMKHLLTK
jgi:5S rRNA maturation endonuclease (ribonuclease M5)